MTAPEGVTMQTLSPNGAALLFVKEYCEKTEFFTPDQACDAAKAAGVPPPPGGKGWRDNWGQVMRLAKQAGYIRKAGVASPTSKDTHVATVTLWQSMLYKGEKTLLEVGVRVVEEMRKKWVTKEIKDIRTLLERTYEMGVQRGMLLEQQRKEAKNGQGKKRKE